MSHWQLFQRFLRFGFLAWGGPVAQIAMLRKELVDDERWVSSGRFNRTLALYQVLPGPEAHELCVYFGYLAKGRPGGVLAGLGFMLPGFLLMFALTWVYVTFGITGVARAIFYGIQPAVVALIVRAMHRIGGHALHDRWLWGIAVVAAVAALAGVPFWITLPVGGVAYLLVKREMPVLAAVLGVLFVAGAGAFVASRVAEVGLLPGLPVGPGAAGSDAPTASTGTGSESLSLLFLSGLKAGLLTFGGAYTVISFLQRDAVSVGAWMTNSQFLDGLALSGVLPAPLIIFSTFVGYLGGGPLGAIALTVGIFLPAFSFTLIGHELFERLIQHRPLHAFLDGVTVGVVGLITATALGLFLTAVTDLPRLLIFAVALFLLFRWKNRLAILWIVLGAGVVGLALSAAGVV
ncbi:MAG: Chromate transport protein ChrA [uncultured Chloroflexi bacterium]|uniref:Chromate transport protein ChrA n=1 Tax=uncultured Chloroflexota bacterium TaxID=166587 RepID=A0A6J4I238_9CHLR|nr:MAG: Chromate transport protein ChrA [uncultured Chloroflexota bacterium]